MAERGKAIVVDGLDHGAAPFPVAVRRGGFIFSSALHGRDPESGTLPATVEEQARGVMANIRRVLDAAGAVPADVVKVVLFAQDRDAVRKAVHEPWTELFPDPADRPVRHTVGAELPAGLLVQAEFIAIVEDSTA